MGVVAMIVAARIQIEPLEVLETYNHTMPDFVVWSDGDCSHAASFGFVHNNEMYVSVSYGDDAPNEFYQASGVTPVLNGSVLTYARKWVPNDLEQTKTELAFRTDGAAEASRNKYLTGGAGQALVYQQKYAQALAYGSDPNPDASRYPLLQATVGIDGKTIKDVAAAVLSRGNKWLAVASDIEKVRLQTKGKISAADTVDEAYEAYRGVVFP